MKTCSKCSEFLQVDMFYKNRSKPGALDYYCKACRLLSNYRKKECPICAELINLYAQMCKSCHNKKRKGDNHWNWKGGITLENQMIRNSNEYKRWRIAVLKRDMFRCIECSSTKHLQADHIKSFALYPKLRLDINNGRTLCTACHALTPSFRRPILTKVGL